MALITNAQFLSSEAGSPVKMTYEDGSTAVVYGFGANTAAADLLIWAQTPGNTIAAPAIGSPTDVEVASIIRLKGTDEYQVLDKDGKAVVSFKRDAAGNAELQAVDTTGNKRRVLTPQAGTAKLDSISTILDVTFEEAFADHPVVNMTPSKPLPNYDMTVTKTGFSVDFASAPASTIGWEAKSRKR